MTSTAAAGRNLAGPGPVKFAQTGVQRAARLLDLEWGQDEPIFRCDRLHPPHVACGEQAARLRPGGPDGGSWINHRWADCRCECRDPGAGEAGEGAIRIEREMMIVGRHAA